MQFFEFVLTANCSWEGNSIWWQLLQHRIRFRELQGFCKSLQRIMHQFFSISAESTLNTDKASNFTKPTCHNILIKTLGRWVARESGSGGNRVPHIQSYICAVPRPINVSQKGRNESFFKFWLRFNNSQETDTATKSCLLSCFVHIIQWGEWSGGIYSGTFITWTNSFS